MYDSINDKFVAILKNNIPDGEQLVPTLMDILSLGKETIYRRLRSEVPFSFEEVVKIALRLGISVDHIVEKGSTVGDSKWVTFNMDVFHSASNYMFKPEERYKMYMSLFSEVLGARKSVFRSASNTVPYLFLPYHETLCKFKYYRWMYMVLSSKPDFLFSKMQLPPDTINYEKDIMQQVQQMQRGLCIINNNAFATTISDIKYFSRRNLISEDELRRLKNELLELITEMETLATNGTYKTGTEITFYISDVDLNFSSFHIEYDSTEMCAFWIYFIDNIFFSNAKMCKKQKEWIEALKKYSVNITQSNEEHRFEFFNKQRELIELQLN